MVEKFIWCDWINLSGKLNMFCFVIVRNYVFFFGFYWKRELIIFSIIVFEDDFDVDMLVNWGIILKYKFI